MRLSSLLVVVCTACAPSAKSGDQGAESPAIHAIPADLVDDIDRALRLGRLIHRQDRYAWEATDAVMALTAGKGDPRIRGWVVSIETEGTVVTFVGEEAPLPKPVFRVTFAPDSTVPAAAPSPPDDELTPEQATLFLARQTAIAAPFRPCSEKYNTVVLPASLLGQEGFLVYLLPATTISGVVLVGGYYRVHVSSDGRRILGVTPFSRSCLALPPPDPRQGRVAGVVFSHLVTEAPVETHVFLSLLHQKPMFVATTRGIWQVTGDKILFAGDWDRIRKERGDPAD